MSGLLYVCGHVRNSEDSCWTSLTIQSFYFYLIKALKAVLKETYF